MTTRDLGQGGTSYVVLGTGALGGLYGGLLANSGLDVHFLMRSDYDYVRKHGLRVDSPLGDFHLPKPNVYAKASELPKVDVVLVCWKATQNERLAEALRAACHSTTIVLVLQNGLDVERACGRLRWRRSCIGRMLLSVLQQNWSGAHPSSRFWSHRIR